MIEKNNLTLLITEREIQSAIHKLVDDIQDVYEGQQIVFVSSTASAFMFTADLARAISNDLAIEFLYVKKNDLGEIYVTASFVNDLKGKHVIIIGDVISSGKLTQTIYDIVQKEQPQSTRVISLIDRQTNQKDIGFTYTSLFQIPKSEFICGYGMNYRGHYANLKDVYIVESTLYKNIKPTAAK